LEENLGALKIELTPEEQAEIRKAVDAVGISGDRYPEQYDHPSLSTTRAVLMR